MKPKAKEGNNSRISCRAPKAIAERVSEIAESLGVSDSDILRMAVNKFLPQFEKGALKKN